jgi:hypothetical protein
MGLDEAYPESRIQALSKRVLSQDVPLCQSEARYSKKE